MTRPGLIARSSAGPNPRPSIAPGRRPCTTTSAPATSSSERGPGRAAAVRSSAAHRLPGVTTGTMAATSANPGGSRRRTSAPWAARNRVQTGPAMTRVRSSTLTPASGRPPARPAGADASATAAAVHPHGRLVRRRRAVRVAAPRRRVVHRRGRAAAVDDGRPPARPPAAGARPRRRRRGRWTRRPAARARRARRRGGRRSSCAGGSTRRRPVVAGHRVEDGRPLPPDRREQQLADERGRRAHGCRPARRARPPGRRRGDEPGDGRRRDADRRGGEPGDVEHRRQHVARAGHLEPTEAAVVRRRGSTSCVGELVDAAASSRQLWATRRWRINVDRSTLTDQPSASDPEVEEVVVAQRLERVGSQRYSSSCPANGRYDEALPRRGSAGRGRRWRRRSPSSARGCAPRRRPRPRCARRRSRRRARSAGGGTRS